MKLIDSRAWLLWLLIGSLLTIYIRNPLYLFLLLVISRVVDNVCSPKNSTGWQLPFWRISAFILLFSTLFNMLTAHVGRTPLITLPSTWWLVGGPLTAEAAVYGFISGLSLVTLLSFFLAFNAVVPTSELAGMVPGALHELGLVVLVAVTYVPETARQYRRIREAQAIRGHRLRGLRDWQPIVIPILIGGLERAMNLAETMVARGYGSTTASTTPLLVRLFFLGGLLLSLGGAIRLAWSEADGWVLILGGVLAIGIAYRELSRGVTRTSYRPRSWSWPDTIIVVSTLVPVSIILLSPAITSLETGYSPYPGLSLPSFNPWVGLLLLGLAGPALVEVLS